MTLADNFLDFSYLSSLTETGAFFPYDFNQTSTLEEYTNPIRSSIVGKTQYGTTERLDLSSPIVAGDSAVLTAMFFCDAHGANLDDYTLWSIQDGVFFDDNVGKWDNSTWSDSFSSIICTEPFDVSIFEAQQLYDIKQFVFYGMLLAIIAFGVVIFKPFIFDRNDV